ncbi:MAG: hypothetical protein ACJAS9_000802 [Polaribacter sp.]|jgi:hypothetical protein
MAKFINSEIKIVKLDGKSIQGVLQKNDEKKLVIDRKIDVGTITTMVKPKQIREFFVYR